MTTPCEPTPSANRRVSSRRSLEVKSQQLGDHSGTTAAGSLIESPLDLALKVIPDDLILFIEWRMHNRQYALNCLEHVGCPQGSLPVTHAAVSIEDSLRQSLVSNGCFLTSASLISIAETRFCIRPNDSRLALNRVALTHDIVSPRHIASARFHK